MFDATLASEEKCQGGTIRDFTLHKALTTEVQVAYCVVHTDSDLDQKALIAISKPFLSKVFSFKDLFRASLLNLP